VAELVSMLRPTHVWTFGTARRISAALTNERAQLRSNLRPAVRA